MIGFTIFLITMSVATNSTAMTTVISGSCIASAITRNTATIISEAICNTAIISAYILLTSAVMLRWITAVSASR